MSTLSSRIIPETLGSVFDSSRPEVYDLPDAVYFEDDHGLHIQVTSDIYIRVEPQAFPKLIALMAETMDGMVDF